MKRRIAFAIAILGVVLVGSQLARAWPRDVSITYAVDPDVVEIAVDYVQAGQAAESVRFRQLDAKTKLIQHTARLQPGVYEARITLYRAGGQGQEIGRKLVIPTDGPVRFDLRGPAEPPK